MTFSAGLHYASVFLTSLEMKIPMKGHDYSPTELLHNAVLQAKVKIWRRLGTYAPIGLQSFKEMQTAVSEVLQEYKYKLESFIGWLKVPQVFKLYKTVCYVVMTQSDKA